MFHEPKRKVPLRGGAWRELWSSGQWIRKPENVTEVIERFPVQPHTNREIAFAGSVFLIYRKQVRGPRTFLPRPRFKVQDLFSEQVACRLGLVSGHRFDVGIHRPLPFGNRGKVSFDPAWSEDDLILKQGPESLHCSGTKSS